MKKMILPIAIGAMTLCAHGAIDLRTALLNAESVIANGPVLGAAHVSGGTKGVHYPSDSGFEPYNLMDGITKNEASDQRWLGKMAPGSTDTNVTTFIQFSTEGKLAGGRCKIVGYRMHKLTAGWKNVERAPTQWKLIGVQADGTEVVVDEKTAADGIVWDAAFDYKADSKYFEVDNDGEFVKFVWIPTSSVEAATNLTEPWNVGLAELEIFIEDEKDPIPGVNLARWMKQNGYRAADYVSGGTANVNYRSGNGPAMLFDGVRHSTVRNGIGGINFWFGRIDAQDASKQSYARIRIPEELAGGVRPTGYRLFRIPTGVAVPLPPTEWEFYGIAADGTTNLLSEVALSDANWNGTSGTTVLHYGETALDNPNGTKFTEFLWIPRKSVAGGMSRTDFNTALMEVEIFFDPEEIPAGRNLVDEIRRANLNVADYVSGGGCHSTYNHSKVFDGVTSGVDYGSTRCFMGNGTLGANLGSLANSYLAVEVPAQLYPNGVSPAYYRVHRNSFGTTSLLRAPLTWELLGVTKSGRTNVISSVTNEDAAQWTHVPYLTKLLETVNVDVYDTQGSDPQYCEVTNLNGVADRNYVKFIWKPLSSAKSLSEDKGDGWVIGLQELEIFVGDALPPQGTMVILR